MSTKSIIAHFEELVSGFPDPETLPRYVDALLIVAVVRSEGADFRETYTKYLKIKVRDLTGLSAIRVNNAWSYAKSLDELED